MNPEPELICTINCVAAVELFTSLITKSYSEHSAPFSPVNDTDDDDDASSAAGSGSWGPPPPPPPPTPEELERQRLAQDKAAEFAGRPQDLRYLGFFKGTPSGTVAAFMKGEEPVTLTSGALFKERWKLVSILDTRAEFQNTKYPDLRLVLEVREASSGTAVNQF